MYRVHAPPQRCGYYLSGSGIAARFPGTHGGAASPRSVPVAVARRIAGRTGVIDEIDRNSLTPPDWLVRQTVPLGTKDTTLCKERMTLSHVRGAVFSGYPLLDIKGAKHLPVVPHTINEGYDSAHEVIKPISIEIIRDCSSLPTVSYKCGLSLSVLRYAHWRQHDLSIGWL